MSYCLVMNECMYENRRDNKSFISYTLSRALDMWRFFCFYGTHRFYYFNVDAVILGQGKPLARGVFKICMFLSHGRY